MDEYAVFKKRAFKPEPVIGESRARKGGNGFVDFLIVEAGPDIRCGRSLVLLATRADADYFLFYFIGLLKANLGHRFTGEGFVKVYPFFFQLLLEKKRSIGQLTGTFYIYLHAVFLYLQPMVFCL